MKTNVLIVGSGCAGLYAALQLPHNLDITIVTKKNVESSDSYLAQGGICMLKNEADYEPYYNDTMKAGHYENDKKSVEIMIRSSQDTIHDLISYGVRFHRDENGALDFTREGAHSDKRILFHEDITGKEITSHLYEKVLSQSNVHLYEYTTLVDIIEHDNICFGGIVRYEDGTLECIEADYTLLATGGIGGLYRHSTNFKQLTGDALAIAIKHHVSLQNVNYIQIHPTTLYSDKKEDRSFLISESVRGEGAKLLDKNFNRFTNELLPRDLLTKEIYKQMKKDGTNYVWEDLRTIDPHEVAKHFPNIVEHCKEMGYDVYQEPIPVVPAQHYFMGGILVDYSSKTTMDQLYAIGETACNRVHGRNRLASNSLLEALVFAKRAVNDIMDHYPTLKKDHHLFEDIDFGLYNDYEKLAKEYATLIRAEIAKANALEEV